MDRAEERFDRPVRRIRRRAQRGVLGARRLRAAAARLVDEAHDGEHLRGLPPALRHLLRLEQELRRELTTDSKALLYHLQQYHRQLAKKILVQQQSLEEQM